MEELSILISGVSLLVSIFLAGYTGYNNSRLKKLESELDIKKSKSLLNDKQNRDIFDKFITLYLKQTGINGGKKPNDKELSEYMLQVKKTLLIYGAGITVKSFNDFITISQQKGFANEQLFDKFEIFIRRLRDDIGVDNNGLDKYSLLQLFVNEDIEDKFKN